MDVSIQQNPEVVEQLTKITIPVTYTSAEGLGLLLAQIGVSAHNCRVRTMTTPQFISGAYDFPVPDAYKATPYTLPMLEPVDVVNNGDNIKVFTPVNLYIVGSTTDLIPENFQLHLWNSKFISNNIQISPSVAGQEIYVVIFKQPNTTITGTNLVTSLPLENLLDLNFIAFKAVFINNTWYVTEWISPSGAVGGKAGGDLMGTYPNPQIKNYVITAQKISDGAVLTNAIANGNVTQEKMAVNSVGTPQIIGKSVTGDKVADNTINFNNLADQAVTKEKIADGAVGQNQIEAGGVNTNNLVDKSVTGAKIAAKTVAQENLADNSVNTPQIVNQSVTADKIAKYTITKDQIADETIDTNNIAPLAITNDKMAEGSVGLAQFNFNDDPLRYAVLAFELTAIRSPLVGVNYGGVINSVSYATEGNAQMWKILFNSFQLGSKIKPEFSIVQPVYHGATNPIQGTYDLYQEDNNTVTIMLETPAGELNNFNVRVFMLMLVNEAV